MIQTKFQEIFGTKYAIVQGGMGPYDTTLLAAAVAEAGGLGLISTAGMGSFHIPNIGDFRYSSISISPSTHIRSKIRTTLESVAFLPLAFFLACSLSAAGILKPKYITI